jgi:hypothetical protein
MEMRCRFILLMLCFTCLVFSEGCGGGGHGPSADAVSQSADTAQERDTSSIINASLPLCKAGVPYESNSATHAPAAVQVKDGGSYRFSLASGSLPAGLVLAESGVVSGTTSASPGPYPFTIQATDLSNQANTFTQAMTILVTEGKRGAQPCDAILKNPRAYYVHQDSALCGPTAFYMILKYFGDSQPGKGPTNADLAETIPREGSPVVSSSSKVCAYLNGISKDILPGTSWTGLEDAAALLRIGLKAFYPCIQSNPEDYGNDDAGAETRLKMFGSDLVPFLQTNSPVIIHLKRPYGMSGHYLVLIGYDQDTDQVLYLDPNDVQFDPRKDGYEPDTLGWTEAVRRVSKDAFTREAWYQKSGYLDAYWDGKWLGFAH